MSTTTTSIPDIERAACTILAQELERDGAWTRARGLDPDPATLEYRRTERDPLSAYIAQIIADPDYAEAAPRPEREGASWQDISGREFAIRYWLEPLGWGWADIESTEQADAELAARRLVHLSALAEYVARFRRDGRRGGDQISELGTRDTLRLTVSSSLAAHVAECVAGLIEEYQDRIEAFS